LSYPRPVCSVKLSGGLQVAYAPERFGDGA